MTIKKPMLRLTGVAIASAIAMTTMTACGDGATKQAAEDEFGVKEVAAVADLVPSEFKSKQVSNSMFNDFPPQEYMEGNTLTGLNVDLVNAAAAVAGIELKNVPTGSFDSIIPGLTGGRYDMAASGFGVSDERIQQIDMLNMYDVGTGFAVKEGSGIVIKSGEDLCGLTVGLLAGAYFIDEVKGLSSTCESNGADPIVLQTFPNQSAAVLAVSNGRADAYAASTDQLAYVTSQSGSGIETTGDFSLSPVPQSIGFPKGSPLVEVFQAAFQQLVKDGTYAQILEKWHLTGSAYTKADDIAINSVEGTS